MKQLNKLADALEDLMERQEKIEKLLAPLKKKEDALREKMLQELKKNRLASFRSEDGTHSYVRAVRSGYEIKDDMKALEWARGADCISIDKRRMASLLRGVG